MGSDGMTYPRIRWRSTSSLPALVFAASDQKVQPMTLGEATRRARQPLRTRMCAGRGFCSATRLCG